MHIQYQGNSYTIADGYTNYAFAYWTPSVPNNLVVSNTFPVLGPSDCLIFLNKSGTAVTVPTSTVIPGDLIVPGSVIADAIAASTITGDKIAAGAITADNIASNTITSELIAADAIGAEAIAAGAIISDAIVSEAITADKIAANAVTANSIAANAIGASAIAAGVISTDKLAAEAVTADKIQSNSITSNEIAANAITADRLAASVGEDLDISANGAITLRVTKTELEEALSSLNASVVVEGDGLHVKLNGSPVEVVVMSNKLSIQDGGVEIIKVSGQESILTEVTITTSFMMGTIRQTVENGRTVVRGV